MLLFTAFMVLALRAEAEPLEIDITHTSIDNLLQMDVTTVSKTSESFWGTAGSIYVLTAEKIRRSGATSVPEALRVVPGVQAFRIDANKWAVTVRGFNGRTANKLLVLVDGRAIYDLLFAGVLWETKAVLLEDVERIEVIRGPGGTLWGANAVNGVINIITKNAKDTQGGLVVAGGGTLEREFGSLRYGAKVGENSYLRAYGRYADRASGHLPDREPDDDSKMGRAGFRLDSLLSLDDAFTLQGDYVKGTHGSFDRRVTPDQRSRYSNLLAKWKRTIEPGEELSLTTYFDHTDLQNPVLDEDRNTVFSELQYLFHPLSTHRVVAGLTYIHSKDELTTETPIAIEPKRRTDDIVAIFAEDRIELLKEKVFFSIGAKAEHNDYTGYEVQPSTRLSWLIDSKNSVWGAVSRAVRVPSRLEDDLNVDGPNGPVLNNESDLQAERVYSYEIGYRTIPMESFFIDLATFYSAYDQLLNLENRQFGNKLNGRTFGAEASLSWQAYEDWQLELGLTHLELDLSLDSDSLDNSEVRVARNEGLDPSNQASLQSLLKLGDDWEVDTILRYVDSLRALNVGSYFTLNLRVGYAVNEALSISVIGQDLLDSYHYEHRDNQATQIQRGVFAKVLYTF